MLFDVFRYQILPIDRRHQGDLFKEPLGEIIKRKNEYFFDALHKVEKYTFRKVSISHVVLLDERDFILYRFNVNRSITRETRYFEKEEIDNWPSFFVFIWNDPEKQYIAVQSKKAAFQDTAAVSRIIINGINKFLHDKFLRAHFEPIFNECIFWDFVKKNEGGVRSIVFDIVTPNMSNISRTLSEDLKVFARNTNAVKTRYSIKADDESSLIVEQKDEQLSGLVDYASEGGGNISIKLKGINKMFHMNDNKKQIQIDELEIDVDGSKIAETLRILLSDE